MTDTYKPRTFVPGAPLPTRPPAAETLARTAEQRLLAGVFFGDDEGGDR